MLTDKFACGGGIKSEKMPHQKPAEKLHKQIIGKFNKSKVHSSFIDNIWCGDLADMQ